MRELKRLKLYSKALKREAIQWKEAILEIKINRHSYFSKSTTKIW
jgi:hypothetical protein